MVNLKDGIYVVELPECHLYQPHDPATGLPFADQAAAQAFEDGYIAQVAATAAAVAAAQAAELAAQISLIVTADKVEAAVGASFTITATLKDGHGNVVPSSDTFAVPVQDDQDVIVKVKNVTLVNGTATVNISFDKSGYYRITEEGLNRKLTTMRIVLPRPFEVTVFE